MFYSKYVNTYIIGLSANINFFQKDDAKKNKYLTNAL